MNKNKTGRKSEGHIEIKIMLHVSEFYFFEALICDRFVMHAIYSVESCQHEKRMLEFGTIYSI